MLYLLGEIFVYLLLAFILGTIIGWAFSTIIHAKKIKKITSISKINVMSMEQQLNEARLALQYSKSGHFTSTNTRDNDSTTKDDLKKISGIGPVLEKHLNNLGISTFEQISRLSKKDMDWLSTTMEAFPDRIERDHWVEQAKELLNNKVT